MKAERRSRASARRLGVIPAALRRRFVHLACLFACLAGCGSSDPGRSEGGADASAIDAGWADGAGDTGEDAAEDAADGAAPADGSEAAPSIDGPADAPADPGPALMPLSTGNRWEYEVREPGRLPVRKTQVVEQMEPVGGRGPQAAELAFRMVTTKPGGPLGLPDRTVSWQRAEGSKVIRLRELAYQAGTDTINAEEYWTPYKLRVDGRPTGQPPAPGQRWEERYVEHKVAPSTGAVTSVNHVDVWTITAVDVAITVPAGQFSGCVQLQKTDGTGSDTGKSYVFCPGVGKVREQGRAGPSQSEELTAYQVAP